MGPKLGPAWTAWLHGHEAMTILSDETRFDDRRFPAV